MVEKHHQLRVLIQRANDTFSLDPTLDVEQYLGALGGYLEQFNDWQRVIESGGTDYLSTLAVEERDELRDLVLELDEIHQRIISRVDENRTRLGLELGEVHRRGKALRAYVDHLPPRISITGKRKG